MTETRDDGGRSLVLSTELCLGEVEHEGGLEVLWWLNELHRLLCRRHTSL